MAESGSRLPIAFVAHSLPDRTRLRIPDRRHNPAYFAQLAARLSAHPRVRQVTVNAGTGSALVRHEGEIGTIAADLQDIVRVVSRASESPAPRAVSALRTVVPPNTLQIAAAGFVALSAWQLRRGRLLGTASESLWNAYNAWQHLQAPGIAAVFLGSSIVQLSRGQVLSPAASLLFYAMNIRATLKGGGRPVIPK